METRNKQKESIAKRMSDISKDLWKKRETQEREEEKRITNVNYLKQRQHKKLTK